MSNRNDRGLFITIEGPDGSGKTTQLTLLQSSLTKLGHEVVIAREPGGTKWGQRIREIFLEGQGELAPMSEVMLLLAAKAQLFQDVINPALTDGKIVLMDRYNESLLAYQGGGREMGYGDLVSLLRVSHLLVPTDTTIFMDTPLTVCLERLNERREGNNQIDALSIEYHQRVHAAYQEIFDPRCLHGHHPLRTPHDAVFYHPLERERLAVRIDGTLTRDRIHLEILTKLGGLLEEYSGLKRAG